ncbi:hypothetical protein TARUN_9928 [Trichoderma arundinaceum]|uniref:CID domain-containing protein n=1 Tax=Trichoderma arundinaceum TaxID=490622 RepID=A0A395N8X6_TRIAR|nr:hypothetical protein TARUN_9928 [Trichoderma arundinaceum]
MASPELAITKATLSATLFRADPTSLNRAAVDDFFSLLDNAIIQCSRRNVQKCKAWIVENIVPSTARCTALGKFWAVLSKNLAVENDGKRPSTKRRRLHLLYVVNDVLFHEVIRQSNGKLGEAWAGALPAMVGNAAAFDNCPKHKTKLSGLIDLWEERAYFSPEVVTQLRTALANGSAEITAVNLELSESSLKLAKDAPYILPSFHGDASIPWPMIPDQIRPIQLAAGPAEKRVVDAVKMLLKDADYIYSKDSEPSDDLRLEFSELGERIVLDEITGESARDLHRKRGQGQGQEAFLRIDPGAHLRLRSNDPGLRHGLEAAVVKESGHTATAAAAAVATIAIETAATVVVGAEAIVARVAEITTIAVAAAAAATVEAEVHMEGMAVTSVLTRGSARCLASMMTGLLTLLRLPLCHLCHSLRHLLTQWDSRIRFHHLHLCRWEDSHHNGRLAQHLLLLLLRLAPPKTVGCPLLLIWRLIS